LASDRPGNSGGGIWNSCHLHAGAEIELSAMDSCLGDGAECLAALISDQRSGFSGAGIRVDCRVALRLRDGDHRGTPGVTFQVQHRNRFGGKEASRHSLERAEPRRPGHTLRPPYSAACAHSTSTYSSNEGPCSTSMRRACSSRRRIASSSSRCPSRALLTARLSTAMVSS
jgi:hypothetical protein